MDGTAIKNFCVWARRELLSEVERRCAIYDVSEEPENPAGADAVGGRVLSAAEKRQRKGLLDAVGREGYGHLVERAAYTWFNRLMAIRYMEANDLLPSRTRMLSGADGSARPQVLADALSVDIEGLDRALVAGLVRAGDDEATFRCLFLAQCAELADCMPAVFDKVGSDMELLLPGGLLREGGVVDRLVSDIPEGDWREGVQIVGWMYQYYVSEKKDAYFASKDKKATAEDIPCATQLFTPDWIVRYLTENSLGRLWILNDPESKLASQMEYYIAPDGDPGEFIKVKSPEEITVLDPACGSGHILVYAFDLLAAMYAERGYARRDIPRLILEKNLTGIEIDPRAAAMASFALTMKACEYDSRFLRRGVMPRITALHKVEFDEEQRRVIASVRHDQERLGAPSLLDQADLLEALAHLDEVGSLLEPTPEDMGALRATADALENETGLFGGLAREQVADTIEMLEPLAAKYDVVIANPPYMGSGNMNGWLSGWVKDCYPDEKSDLCTCFIKRGISFSADGGSVAMITASSWMFISSFEKMRRKLISSATITSMIQQSTHGYPNVTVPTCMWVMLKGKQGIRGSYIRLEDFDRPQWQQPKALEAIQNPDCGWFYRADEEGLKSIPGWPIAYWAGKGILQSFDDGKALKDYVVARDGIHTCNNALFLRIWWEESQERIGFGMRSNQEASASGKKWFPYNKGGSFRKWYGNDAYVINWENDGEELRNAPNAHGFNERYGFVPSITWSSISSGQIAFRYKPSGFMFDAAGYSMFPKSEDLQRYIHGFLNSSIAFRMLEFLSPTLNYQAGDILKMPLLIASADLSSVDIAVRDCRVMTQEDWNSFETSWDFESHPLAQPGEPLIERQFGRWQAKCRKRFDTLKSNEEELNRIFARIYHMEGEVPIEVPDDKVSVRLADRERDVKSLISYAMGCIMGRYSLDKPGLVLANQGDGLDEYLAQVPDPSFMPDEDGIIPLTDVEYFHDDAVGLFCDFLKAAYGPETLEENLRFVADALGGGENPRQAIRDYFRNGFFKDHCQTYSVQSAGKRPIYWLFDSGKKGGFRALFYMHRYTPDLLARLRTEYVHPQQERYRNQLEDVERSLESAGRSEAVALKRRKKQLSDQLAEINEYEEKVHHLADQMIKIDLDDGVKHNYALFRDVLAKIR